MTPVGGSSAVGRYSRWTATSRPSAIVSRNARVAQPGAVGRRGQVAELDADGRHPGQPQQRPGLAVDAVVEQSGAGDQLALRQVGQPLADRRAGLAGAVVVRGDPVRPAARRSRRCAGRAPGRRRRSLASCGALLVGRAVVRAAGQPGLHAERGEPALEPGGEIPDEVGLGDAVDDDAGVVAAVARVEDDAACRAGSGPESATATRSRSSCGRPPTTRRPQLAQRAQRVPGRRCRRRPARSRAGSCAAPARSTGRRRRRPGPGGSRARSAGSAAR